MALSASSSFLRGLITSHELKAPWISSVRLLDQCLVPSLPWDSYRRRLSVKPVCAELRRSDAVVPLAAPVVFPEVEDRVETEDYERLAKELEHASPLEIMAKALEKFGNDIAIAFSDMCSGAEDVALIEYAKLTGRPFRVFSLDTGRLNPETYRFFDTVEKHYDIHIEYMFPDAVEVQALVRGKGPSPSMRMGTKSAAESGRLGL